MEHLRLILLITSFIVPLLYSALQFSYFRNNVSQKIMGYTLLLNSFVFLCNYFYFEQMNEIYIPLHSIHAGFEFFIFPLIYIYINSIVLDRLEIKSILFHLLPGVLMTIVATIIFYVCVDTNDLTFFLEMNRLGYKFEGFQFQLLTVSRYIHLFLLAIQAIIYPILTIRLSRKYDRKLENEFSNVDNFSIRWINRYNFIFIILVVISLIIYTSLHHAGLEELFVITLLFFGSMYISFLGVLSMKKKLVNEDLDIFEEEIVPTSVAELITDNVLLTQLKTYMEENHTYLQPNISLTIISRDLGTNRTYLSKIINQKFGVNFSSFINKYRVNYINKHLANNPQLSNNELAQIGGFGSVLSMKRAMQKFKE